MRSRRSIGMTFVAAIATIVGFGTSPLLASAAGTAAVPNIPTSIPADCSIDVTARLQAWIAASPDGTTLTFAPDACYRVDGTIVVTKRSGLTIDGNHSRFRAMTDGSELGNPARVRNRNMWTFMQDDHLQVRNVISFGANPSAGTGDQSYKPKFEAQHAYLIQGSTDMTMDHVEAYDVYGDFVFVGPSTQRLTVRNSTFARNGRQGWTIYGTDIVFEHNSITDTRRATIDMEPTFPTWSSHNIWIRDNDIGRGRLLFFANVGAAKAQIDGINIIGNRFHNKAMTMYVSAAPGYRSNYHVVGNVSDSGVSGSGAAMVFRNVTGLEVRGNVQRVQATHYLVGVGLRGTSHVVVANNHFRGAQAAFYDHGENVDIAQFGNMIGNPERLAAPTRLAGPTPIPPPRVPGPNPAQ